MKHLKYLIGSALVIFFLIGLGFFCYYNPHDQRIIKGVKVVGVPLGGLTLTAAEELLKNKTEIFLRQPISFYTQNHLIKISPTEFGLRIDHKKTASQAYLLGHSGSIWSRIASRRLIHRQGQEVKPKIFFDKEALNNFLSRLESEINTPSVRAEVIITPEGKVKYTKGQVGYQIKRAELLAKIEAALNLERISQIEIPIEKINPVLSGEEIEKWGLHNILGIYTTAYNANNADREHNIVNAAAAINNVLVFPKQVFSFNSWVGPRLLLTGYREAPVIYQGKVISGVGGGVCQVSSTLYNAVLLANLSVVKRINHSLASEYVPLARDAAVVDGVVDFSFRNLNQKPVLIVANARAGKLTLAIMGENQGWSKVELETIVLEEYPFVTKEILDPTSLLGERIKIQEGKAGYKAELWRTTYFNDGKTKHEKINMSIYKSRDEEYKIGTNSFGNSESIEFD